MTDRFALDLAVDQLGWDVAALPEGSDAPALSPDATRPRPEPGPGDDLVLRSVEREDVDELAALALAELHLALGAWRRGCRRRHGRRSRRGGSGCRAGAR